MESNENRISGKPQIKGIHPEGTSVNLDFEKRKFSPTLDN